MKYYVTYGVHSDQGKNFSTFEALNHEAGRRFLMEKTGGKFAFWYDTKGWLLHGGELTQNEVYDLTEIPLQPQTFTDPAA